MNQIGTRGTVGGRAHRLRDAFVVAQIALALTLTSSAGLLLRSFFSLNRIQLGYKPEGLLVAYAHTPASTLNEHIAAARTLANQVLPELSVLPHVSSVAAVMGLPTGRYGSNGKYAVVGKHEFKPGAKLPDADFTLSTPNYFATMRIPLLGGRDFTARDEFDSQFVAIISESLARQVFPTEDPIGRQIVCGLDSPNPMTIIGIVGDVRQSSPASKPGPVIYMPLQQHPYFANEVQVVVRTAARPTDLTNAVRQTFHKINPAIATKFARFDSMVAGSIAIPRSRTFLVATFAAFALILAMAGVYSVMSYIVGLRIPELGLRMAMGASPADVLRLILFRASTLIAAGLIAGILLSLLARQMLKSMLFGLEPSDPVTNFAVITGVAITAGAAALAPALRASRIDPVAALANA